MARRQVGDREQQVLEMAGRLLPGGSNGNTVTMGTIIASGRGPRVWDVSGNEYVDYALGSGPMLIGHAHPEVVAAVEAQLSKGDDLFRAERAHGASGGGDRPRRAVRGEGAVREQRDGRRHSSP